MKPSTVWIAIVLLALGVCGILDAAGIADTSQTIAQWWPLAIVGWATSEMLAERRVTLVGVQGLANSAGVSTAAWQPHLVHTMITGYFHLTLCVLLWGVAGLCIGILTRSAGISIAIGSHVTGEARRGPTPAMPISASTWSGIPSRPGSTLREPQ